MSYNIIVKTYKSRCYIMAHSSHSLNYKLQVLSFVRSQNAEEGGRERVWGRLGLPEKDALKYVLAN